MRRAALPLFVYLAAMLGCALIAARAHYTTDLSAFLPGAPTAAQRVLIEQLREGPAARLIIAAIGGGSAQARAHAAEAMVARLRPSKQFASVSDGDAATLARDREFLFAHRYALSPTVTPQRFTAAGLHAAISDSLAALASSEGPLLKPLFARDPTGELLNILDALGSGHNPRTREGVWSSRDATQALILLQTRAPGADTDAQQRAVEAVRGAFAEARSGLGADGGGLRLTLTGPPVFAVGSRALIKSEVMRLSGLSAALIALLLLLVYRSPLALALGLLPVASGALAGIAAVALGFGAVHGITLGFGVTLIGEAVDYSIYLFVQGAAQEDWRIRVWPTLRLGMLTSVAGFAALVPSQFQGLAQLGLYSIAGLIVAALVTRYLLPAWLPERLCLGNLAAPGRVLGRAVTRIQPLWPLLAAVPLAFALVLAGHRGPILSHELAALSPVPLAEQDLDERLRADLGAPDVRFMVVAQAADAPGALAAAARLAARLDPLVDQGVIAGFDAASRFLPPPELQRARREALPATSELRSRLAAAVAGLPLRAEVLEPFVSDVAAARGAPPLTRADLEGTSFAAAADALLMRSGSGYAALLPLAGVGGDLSERAVAAVNAAVAAGPEHAVLLNLKDETDRLYLNYLHQAITLSLAGCAVIVLLLALALRSFARVLRVIAPLVLAVLGVTALLIGLGQPLTILHLIGLLLIVAVGSNYALFFDRLREHPKSAPLTLASLLIANVATVLAFGVLASSRVPVLAALGTTVAPGALLALLFAAMLAPPPAQETRA